MNKILALILGTLLISSVSAGFLTSLLDNGEDHGEDSGEQHFSGNWSQSVYSDNGESVDSGEFSATVYNYDQGEFYVKGTFQRYQYTYVDGGEDHGEDNGEYRYTSDSVSDSGEFSHTGFRQNGKFGKFSEEEIVPTILKRVKRS